jgi:hypothetical protein
VPLGPGPQLDAAQLDAAGRAGDPQPAGRLAVDLDHAGGAAGDLAPDLPRRPLDEVRTPSAFVEAGRQAALIPGDLEDHAGEEPGVGGHGRPEVITGHRTMLVPLVAAGLLAPRTGEQSGRQAAPMQSGSPINSQRINVRGKRIVAL